MTQEELSERLFSITGHTDDLDEALDDFENTKRAVAELYDDNQALSILNRRMRLCLTIAETAITAVQTENAMFISDKTRGKIDKVIIYLTHKVRQLTKKGTSNVRKFRK